MEYEKPPLKPEVDRVERLRELQASMVPKRKRRRSRRLASLLVLLLVAAAVAVYFFVIRVPEAAAPAPQPAQSQAPEPTAPAVQAEMKVYDAAAFSMLFEHPETWTVIDKNDGQVIVTSPATKLPIDGRPQTGQIVMTIRTKAQALSAFDGGDGAAVLDSVKLAYAQPSQTQRGQTYLSYVQYPATTTIGMLDALYITSDFGYQKGQLITKTDLASLDPQVSVVFKSCSGDPPCKAPKPAQITATTWAASPEAKVVQTMLESLVLN